MRASLSDIPKFGLLGFLGHPTYHSPPASFPQSEKAAPIIGPIMRKIMTMFARSWHKKIRPPMRKPREKATPIIAMPLPLVEGVETSVTIAVDKETFPACDNNLYLMLRLLPTF